MEHCRERRPPKPAARIDHLLTNDEPLDEEEQQEVIAALERQQLQQGRVFRCLYGAVALVLAAFFGYAAIQQWLHPWEARYTGELRPVTSAAGVVAVLLLQAAALGAAACGLMMDLPKPAERTKAYMPPAERSRRLVGFAVVMASIGCLYWSSAMYHSIARYGFAVGAKWELSWLPLAPLGYCGVCWHLLTSLGSTSRELQQLQGLAYDFKKV